MKRMQKMQKGKGGEMFFSMSTSITDNNKASSKYFFMVKSKQTDKMKEIFD